MAKLRLGKTLRLDDRPSAPSTVRVALVQMEYNPAYRYKVDYLAEPAGIRAEPSTALSSLTLQDRAMEKQVEAALRRIRETYLSRLESKIVTILDSLTPHAPDIVCFPEYSIPAELIPKLSSFAQHFALVFPSHTVTRQTLAILSEQFGEDIALHPGQAAYIALARGADAFVQAKVTRSRFEPSLATAAEALPLPLLGPASSVVIAMCSDFLQGRIPTRQREENPLLPYLDTATLRIVCSFSPSTEPFFELASQDLLRSLSLERRPTAFVNHFEAGGSSVFALMASEQVLDPTTPESSYRLPPFAEAVSILDVVVGPQLVVKPAPLTPQPESRLVGLRVLIDSGGGGGAGQLGELFAKMSRAREGLQRNIEAGLRKLGDLVAEQDRSLFDAIVLEPNASLSTWRVHAAKELHEALRSIRPSLDPVDRQALDVRLSALEELVGVDYLTASQSESDVSGQKQPGRPLTVTSNESRAVVFEDQMTDGRQALVMVFRLTSLPDNASIEKLVRPMWPLLSSVIRDPKLMLTLQYEIIKGEAIGATTVFHDLSIEVFLVASYLDTGQEDRAAALSLARDIGGLLQTALSESFGFAPVSETLWRKYRASQTAAFRVTAGHKLAADGDGEVLIPFQPHPRMGEVLRFLYARAEPASLSIGISALGSDVATKYRRTRSEPPELQPISQKVESSLDEALEDLNLLDLLRPPGRTWDEQPSCRLNVQLSLPSKPSVVVAEVVMRQLLGDDFTVASEELTGADWITCSGSGGLSPSTTVASVREALSLLRFPSGPLPSFGDRTGSRLYQVPIEVAEGTDGCLIGHAFHRDVADGISVYLSSEDRRKHLYVVGKTGVGKTQFLLTMIMQDIEAGRGVCVMDPHGDLYDDILHRYPTARVNDLVLFDPTDTENPPGLNLFEIDRRDPLQRDFVLDEASSIFLRLFGNEIFGPRIQNYFRNGALALMNDPARERTLLDIARLFLDDAFFRYVTGSVADLSVKDFITEFGKTATRERDEMVPYLQSKFTPFVSNSVMRRVVGQARSTVNFRYAMDKNKVVLVNLSKGKLGELNSRLLGMVLVSKVTWAALSRAHVSQAQRTDFFLYCDEFQSFATDSFGLILSEARKYGLCLTLANQYLGQLRITDNYTTADRDSLRDAVLGNVGNIVAFRVGSKDAQALLEELAGTAEKVDRLGFILANQARFHAIAKLDCRGLPTQPFSLRSVLSSSKSDPQLGNMVAEYVKKRTLLPKEFVEADIASAREDYRRV